jgi:hypothetical protein
MLAQVVNSVRQVNAMALRPYVEQVDLVTLLLAFAILMLIAGQWHLVLEKVEI